MHRHGRLLTGIATLATSAMLAAPGAVAQTQLPGIVVQGATLAPPPARRAPPSPAEPQQGASTPAGPPAAAEAPAAVPAGNTGDLDFAGDVAGGGAGSGSGIGSSTTVVTGEDIRRQQIRNAAEALRSLPGVTVSRGSTFASQTQVRIRGFEANHTLVLIDGVVANDANNGALDFSDLSADNIERIEVIRGPQSGIYGSGALGGVVNIVTKGGRGPLEVTARTEAGSFGTFEQSARASGGNDRAWGSISYSERHSSGPNAAPFGTEKDGSLLKTAVAKGGAKIIDGVTLDYVLRYSAKWGDRDTEGGAPGTLAVQVDDPAHFKSSLFLGGVNLRWDSADGKLTQVVRATRNESRVLDFSTGFTSNNISETVKYGYLGTWRFDTPSLLAASAVTVLVENERETFSPFSDFSDNIERSRGRLATALEYTTEIAKRLSLSANIRHDDNDVIRDYTTWRTAASLKIPEAGLRPHASVGTAVKLPTMFELYGSIPTFFTPNPNLKPETSTGWDAGIEATLWSGRAVLDVTYFQQDLKDKIDGFVPGPFFTFTAENMPGTSHREGLEFSGRVKLASNLVLSGAYTYLLATDAAGLAEIRRPRNSGRIDLAYSFDGGRGTAQLSALYNGAMPDTAFFIDAAFPGFVLTHPERTTLEDYWLVNLAASYRVSPGVEIFGRIENLLNEKYYEVYGFATPGIGAYGGVKLTFGGDGPSIAPLVEHAPAAQRRW